ncbi:MAG: T9SS type A sorting domain-containing protein [Bacteroidia bacterium]
MNKKSKKNQLFLRALVNYSALGGALIGSTIQAQAAIQYAALSGTPVSDGTANVIFPGGGSLSFKEMPGVGSAIFYFGGGASITAATTWYPNRLEAGASINNGGTWRNAGTQFLGWSASTTAPLFKGTSGKFIGVRFNSGGVKYGWIRLDVAGDASSFTLTDWAYQDDGSSIEAGEMPPLPIELFSFDAKALKNLVELNWITTHEENFDGFSLERAEEGESFSEIAWIAGTGNSDESQSYKFQDQGIFENKRYYYRLKSIDINGSFEYSQIIETAFSDFGFTVNDPYPNPVLDKVLNFEILALEAETVSLQIFSATGQVVEEQQNLLSVGSNTISVAISQLAAGMYFLKVNGRYYNNYKQFVIE